VTADPRSSEALGVLSSKSCPFSDFSPDLLRLLLSVMHLREHGAGAYLIRQGDPAEYLLVILDGTATACVHQATGAATPLAEFGPGDVVGEVSLLTDEARTADVIARTPVRSLLLLAADFHKLAETHPELRVMLTNVVADRLGRTTYDGLSGKDIHGYRILRCVGRGGMGIVYEATQLATGDTVALKMLSHLLLYQPAALQRFRREADTLKSLRHDSIAQLYDRFAAYTTQFLVMEFCEGTTVDQLIAARGPLEECVVRKVIGQLASALDYVHALGLAHRDLKPSNVMLARSGLVKLLDFGLAKFDPGWRGANASDADTMSQSIAFIGTPRYMAPEQFGRAGADHRVDVYGLACVAFEMLSGRPLFEAPDFLGIIQAKLGFVLPPPAEIGRGVTIEMHEFLARGLEHRPEKRVVALDRLAAWAGPVEIDALAPADSDPGRPPKWT
jgi:eukaryotic-like serine/threonine-protein kinase